jgi:hypothetical protein
MDFDYPENFEHMVEYARENIDFVKYIINTDTLEIRNQFASNLIEMTPDEVREMQDMYILALQAINDGA